MRLALPLAGRLGGENSPVIASGAALVAQVGSTDLGFGQDFQVLNGVNPAFPLVGGYTNLGQALANRLQTPRGGLFYDLDYGTDVRGYLNAAITPKVRAALAIAIQNECLKDERVQGCTATITADLSTETMTISINALTAQGPFAFIFDVTSASVTLIDSQFNG